MSFVSLETVTHYGIYDQYGMSYGTERKFVFARLYVNAGNPGDVMKTLMDGKNIVSTSRHDGLLVKMVNEYIDEDLGGMAADFTIRMRRPL